METPQREARAKLLRNQVKAAKGDGNTELAAEAIKEIRRDWLWKELGFASFNEYAKSDECPYSSNYAYKMTGSPVKHPRIRRAEPPAAPAPIVFTEEDRNPEGAVLVETGQEGLLELVRPTKDLRGNVLPPKMAALFENAERNFTVLYDSVNQIRETLRVLAAESSGASFSVHNRMEVIMQHLHSVEGIVNNCRPYSVCIFCSGNRKRCACGGVGFLTESQYLDATKVKQ